VKKIQIVEFTPPKSIDAYPLGAAYKAGHLVEGNADWRMEAPVVDLEKCVGCYQCFLVCPDGTIFKKEGKVAIDYRFCKGCGICAKQCAFRAITMTKGGITDGD
jgi:pyruvate ferredoxin oxidoreductase delta subunit